MTYGILYLNGARRWSFKLNTLPEVQKEFNKKKIGLDLFMTESNGNKLFYLKDLKGKSGFKNKAN